MGYHWRALNTIAEVQAQLAWCPPVLVLDAWHSSLPAAPWWRHEATSGGQIVEQTTHLFDLGRLLLGEATISAAHARHLTRAAFPHADIAAASAVLVQVAISVPVVFIATSLLNRSTAVQLQLIGEGLQITITQQNVL